MKKSKLLACLAMAGVLAIGAGTYAIFSDKTVERNNIFTIGTGIDGEIFEPNWEGTEEKGVEYRPDSTISKDPQIKNNSDAESAYIGIQLRYSLPKDAYVTYSNNNDKQYKSNAEVLKDLGYNNEEEYIKALTAETEFNLTLDKFTAATTKNGKEVEGYWIPLKNGDVTVPNSYMYVGDNGKALAVEHGMLTEPIFKEVKIVKDIDIKDMMPFEIHVQGYLVQSTEGINAAEELTNLMNAK